MELVSVCDEPRRHRRFGPTIPHRRCVWDNDGVLSLSAGQIVADKYRIDAVVGSGGMGVVVAATHIELGQRVAIKLLRDVSPEGQARFSREARLLVRLKSAHVARVFDVGSLDDDTPYIVMELLEGSDLGKVLDERKRLGVEESVDWVLEAMCAIAEAHALGMVHRDLKPANLFVASGAGGTKVVKVLDFGVSKLLDERPEGLTNEGVTLGSPGYMSPEQIDNSRDVDVRSDIYALGAILYRFVTGRMPYKGDTIVSVMASMTVDPLPPLRSLAPDAPDAFAAAIEKALAKDRNARFADVAELATALAPFGSRRARTSLDEILATVGAPREPSRPVAFSEPPLAETIARPLSRPPRAKATTLPLIGAACVLAVGAAAVAFTIATREPPPRVAIPPDTAPPIDPPPPIPIAPSTDPPPPPEPTPKPSAHPKPRLPPRHPQTGPAEVPPDRH
jgi:serine/threonine-protein kinase